MTTAHRPGSRQSKGSSSAGLIGEPTKQGSFSNLPSLWRNIPITLTIPESARHGGLVGKPEVIGVHFIKAP
jgi:hypothetical protein